MEPVVKDKRYLIGLILIAVGTILTLERMNIMFFPDWLISWQMLLITIGTFSILVNGRPVPGVILMAVGGFFLFQEFTSLNMFAIWPLFLIVAGIIVIISISTSPRGGGGRHRRGRRDRWTSDNTETESEKKNDGVANVDYVDDVAIFGGGQKRIHSENFSGGKMTAIFGGAELDLTDAELAEGTNHLEVVAMFGGWELHVPAHWNVEIKVTPIFGGFDDKRRKMSNEPVDNTRKLVVTGVVIFGGGEINSHIVRK